MRHDILLYSDEGTATGSLLPSLSDAFDQSKFNIRRIGAADITDGVLRAPQSRILVLPGITGDVSPYTAQIPRPALMEIYGFLHKGPNVLLTLCAGSYFISRQTIYTPPWSKPRGRHSIAPIFHGIAKGPVAGYARKSTIDDRFQDVICIPVEYKGEDNTWIETRSCYGNGPAFYPDPENSQDIEIISRYAGVTDRPAAILRHLFGAGTVYLCGIVPDIAYQHIRSTPLQSTYAQRLMEDLKPHEPGRKKLWTMLTNRIKQDLNR